MATSKQGTFAQAPPAYPNLSGGSAAAAASSASSSNAPPARAFGQHDPSLQHSNYQGGVQHPSAFNLPPSSHQVVIVAGPGGAGPAAVVGGGIVLTPVELYRRFRTRVLSSILFTIVALLFICISFGEAPSVAWSRYEERDIEVAVALNRFTISGTSNSSEVDFDSDLDSKKCDTAFSSVFFVSASPLRQGKGADMCDECDEASSSVSFFAVVSLLCLGGSFYFFHRRMAEPHEPKHVVRLRWLLGLPWLGTVLCSLIWFACDSSLADLADDSELYRDNVSFGNGWWLMFFATWLLIAAEVSNNSAGLAYNPYGAEAQMDQAMQPQQRYAPA